MFKIPGLNKNLLSVAWNGVSFSPEKRAEAFNEDFEKTLSYFAERVNQQNITKEQKQECFDYWSNRLHREAEKYLAANSSCISAMIVGPAKFPVARAEKRQRSAEKALNSYCYTQNKLKDDNIFNRYLTAEQKQNRIDEAKWREFEHTIGQFLRFHNKENLPAGEWAFNAFPHLKGMFETQAKNENFAICEKVLAELSARAITFPGIDRNIKILSALLRKYREKSENRKTPETSEQEINGVRVVKNTDENRLQLFFDGKPNAEMITKLKGAAFRWSPRNKAWQRVLTDNAVAAANRILAQ